MPASGELHRLYVRILGDIGDLESKLSKGEKLTEKFGQKMMAVGKGLTIGLTLPIAGMAAGAVKAAADLDRLRRGLIAVEGSGAAADREMQKLRKTAQLPGLGFKEAIQGSIRLQAAFGDIPDKANIARNALEGFGNAIATVGGGKEQLDRVTLALSQIAAKGRVMGQEIMQLQESVPQIRQAMLAAFGTADTQQLQKRNIDAITFVKAITAELKKLPPVTGGAANAFENFSDSVFRAAAAIGNRLLPVVTPAINRLADLAAGIDLASDHAVRMGIGFGTAISTLGPLLIGFGSLLKLLVALKAAGTAWLLVGGVGGAIVAGLAALAGWWVQNKLKAAQFRQELKETADQAGLTAQALAGMGEKDVKAFQARIQAAATATPEQARNRLGQIDARMQVATMAQARLLRNQAQAAAGGDKALAGVFQGTIARWETEITALRAEAKLLRDRLVELGASAHGAGSGLMTFAQVMARMSSSVSGVVGGRFAPPHVQWTGSGFTDTTMQGLQRQGLPFGGITTTMSGAAAGKPGSIQLPAAPAAPTNLNGEIMSLLSGNMGELGSIIGSLAASLGPLAVLIPVVKAAFEALQPIINAIIQPLSDMGAVIGQALAPLFRALAGLVHALMEPMAPLIKMLLEVSLPLKILTAMLRTMAWIVSWVMQAFGWLIEGIGRLVDAIPFVSAKRMIRAGEDMQKAAKDARRNLDNLGKTAEEVNQAFQDMKNIPNILNYYLRRWQAVGGGTLPVAPPSAPGVPGGGLPGGPGGGPGGGGALQGIQVGVVNVYAAPGESAESLWDRMKQLARRDVALGGGQDLVLVTRG